MGTKSYINFLQEWCVEKKYPLPKYTLVQEQGSSQCKNFTICCQILEFTCLGNGSNKKEAKHESAKLMVDLITNKHTMIQQRDNSLMAVVDKNPQVSSLFEENIKPVSPNIVTDNQPTVLSQAFSNPIGFLQEICVKHRLPLPFYEETLNGDNTFKISCTVKDRQTYGEARQKKAAKLLAASNMLRYVSMNEGILTNSPNQPIQQINMENLQPLPIKDEVDNKPPVSSLYNENLQSVPPYVVTDNQPTVSNQDCSNPVGKLQEMCAKNRFEMPKYIDEREGEHFKVMCILSNLKTYGVGNQKKTAKTEAALKMVQLCRDKCKKMQDQKSPVEAQRVLDLPEIFPNLENNDIVRTLKDINHNKQNISYPENDNPGHIYRYDSASLKNIGKHKENVGVKKDKEDSKENLEVRMVETEVERFRKLYHQMSKTEAEAWLTMFCDHNDIDPVIFKKLNPKDNKGSTCSIEIPQKSFKWESNAINYTQARNECSRIAGFILLMDEIKEFRDLKKSHGGGGKNKTGYVKKEFEPFLLFDNWLYHACALANITNPIFEYEEIETNFRAVCRLLKMVAIGQDTNKKSAKKSAVCVMQTKLLRLAKIEHGAENSRENCMKVVDYIISLSNELRCADTINFEEILKSYEKLLESRKNNSYGPSLSNFNGSLQLKGPTVDSIMELSAEDIEICGFECLQDFVQEQNLEMNVNYHCNKKKYDCWSF
uniref:DRBM domain-containing protein n=1 Tax=Clastoptera arizonana TaxID=38151 RepID=A0A1B6E2A9_9HEMI